MNDPYSSTFSTDVLKTRLDAVQAFQLSNSSVDMAARVREMQAAALVDSQLKMQRMQQDMLRTIQENSLKNISQQSLLRQMAYSTFASLPGAIPGTAGIFNRNVGYTASGAYTQNFGGLLADAGVARLINQASGGFFMPGYARQYGASVSQVAETAREELQQRFGDFGRGFVSGITPDYLSSRLGMRFIGQRGDFARNLTSTLSATSLGLGGDIRSDGIGAQLRSTTVQTATDRVMAGIEAANFIRGYSLTSDDQAFMQTAFMDELALNSDSRRSLVSSKGQSATAIFEKVRASLDRLSDTLKVNLEEATRLRREGMGMGLNNRQIGALGMSAGASLVNDNLSADQRAQVLMRLWSVGRSGDYGTGQAFANRQYGLANAIRERLTSQGEAGMAELFRFGGSNATEAALAYQAQRQELGRQFSRGPLGSSLGVAAVSGTGWMSGRLGDTLSDVGAAYSRTPFAYLQALEDPNTRMTMEDRAEAVAYRHAQGISDTVGASFNDRDRRTMKIRAFSKAMGVDFVRAAEMVRRREQTLAGVGGLVGLSGLTAETALLLQEGMSGLGLASGVGGIRDSFRRYSDTTLINAGTGDFTNSEYLIAGGDDQLRLKEQAVFTDVLGTSDREAGRISGVGVALGKAADRLGLRNKDLLSQFFTPEERDNYAKYVEAEELVKLTRSRDNWFDTSVAEGNREWQDRRGGISTKRGASLFTSITAGLPDIVFKDQNFGGYLAALKEEGIVSEDDLIKNIMAASSRDNMGFSAEEARNIVQNKKGLQGSMKFSADERRILFTAIETMRTTATNNTATAASNVAIASLGTDAVRQLTDIFNGR